MEQRDNINKQGGNKATLSGLVGRTGQMPNQNQRFPYQNLPMLFILPLASPQILSQGL